MDACCGLIALGPLGLLCGACGSGTTTDEFWICQDCGNKFSNKEAKEAQKQEELNKQAAKEQYIESKKSSDAALSEYGSKDNIIANQNAASERESAAREAYTAAYTAFVEEKSKTDPKINKLRKKVGNRSGFYTNFCIILILLGVVIACTLVFPLGIAMVSLGLLMIFVTAVKQALAETKLEKLFAESSEEAKILLRNKEESAKESKQWQEKVKALEYCEKYENENQNNE